MSDKDLEIAREWAEEVAINEGEAFEKALRSVKIRKLEEVEAMCEYLQHTDSGLLS